MNNIYYKYENMKLKGGTITLSIKQNLSTSMYTLLRLVKVDNEQKLVCSLIWNKVLYKKFEIWQKNFECTCYLLILSPLYIRQQTKP